MVDVKRKAYYDTVEEEVQYRTPAGVYVPVSAGGAGSGIQYRDTQLTDSQIKSLKATPVELIPAPGVGLANAVFAAYMVSDTRNGAYTGMSSGTTNMQCVYEGDPTALLPIFSVDFGDDGSGHHFMDTAQLTTQIVLGSKDPFFVGTRADAKDKVRINEAVTLFSIEGSELGGGHASNTLSIRMYYAVVPAVPFGA